MQVSIRAIWAFHTVGRMGSIIRAAEELCVTPSAVSQQMQALELQIGTALLAKKGRRVVLTEAGERYFASITDEIERISEATLAMRGYQSVSTLIVRATPTVCDKWILPRLKAFLDAYPDLELRLDGTNEPTDFIREHVDVEIRHGNGRWPGLFVEGLMEEAFLPVASPQLAATGSLAPSDLLSHRLIHSVKSQVQWEYFFKLVNVQPSRHWRRVLFDRSHMAIDAAIDGMGIALESTMMTDKDVRAGRLVFPVANPPEIYLTTQWIVCPRDHIRQKKVRLFLDWLRGERGAAAA